VRLTTSPCKNKFVENLLKKKYPRRGQGSYLGCGACDDDDIYCKEHQMTMIAFWKKAQ
jgi:hypothetical protein